MTIKVFYSFHYSQDVWRAGQVRNIGALDGNKPVNDNEWEDVKKGGDAAIKKWIDNNMASRSCVIVLIGEHAADRKWIRYEIESGWKNNKALFGIYIHDLKDRFGNTSRRGLNPFDGNKFTFEGKAVDIKVYNPSPANAYDSIARNIENWTETALKQIGKS